MAFEYTPYRNPYIGTIADLMARGEDAKAKALIDVASAQARAAEAKGQIYGNAISSIGQQIGNIPAQMQANKEQAFKAEQQARLVRGQQQEDAAETQYNQMVGSKNELGSRFVDVPSMPATLASRNMMLNDDGTMGLRDNPSRPATLASRQMVPTITNPFKELSVKGVNGLDKWDVEKASQQFASLGLGVQGQKYLELMRGSNDDMDKHHASAMDLVKKSAARALQAGSFDMMLGSTNALMSQLANNKVIGREDLSAFQQQLDGLNALPQEQKEASLRGILRNISGQDRRIGNLSLGESAIDLDTQEVLATNVKPNAPVTPSGTPFSMINPDTGKPSLYQKYSDGTIKVIGQPVPSDSNGGNPYFTPVQTADGIQVFNSRTGRFEGRLGDSKPGDTAGRVLADARTTLNLIKTIESKLTPEKIGPITGRYKTLEEGILGKDPDFTELASQISTLQNTVINLRTGAQMSNYEAERILKEIAGVNLPFATAVARLKTSRVYFEEFLKNREDAAYGRRPSETVTTPPPSTKAPTGRYDSATGKIVPIGGA